MALLHFPTASVIDIDFMFSPFTSIENYNTESINQSMWSDLSLETSLCSSMFSIEPEQLPGRSSFAIFGNYRTRFYDSRRAIIWLPIVQEGTGRERLRKVFWRRITPWTRFCVGKTISYCIIFAWRRPVSAIFMPVLLVACLGLSLNFKWKSFPCQLKTFPKGMVC